MSSSAKPIPAPAVPVLCKLCAVAGAVAVSMLTIRGMVDVPNVPACRRCTSKTLMTYPRSTAVAIVSSE